MGDDEALMPAPMAANGAKSRCPWRPVVSGRLRCSIAFWPMQMALPWGLCHFSECRLFRLILFFVPKAIKVWMGSRLGAYPLYECENNISISRTYLACFWPFSLECLLIDSRAPLMLLMSYTFILGMASKNKLFRLCFRAWIEACQLVGNLGHCWHCIQEFEILGETFACPIVHCSFAFRLNILMNSCWQWLESRPWTQFQALTFMGSRLLSFVGPVWKESK